MSGAGRSSVQRGVTRRVASLARRQAPGAYHRLRTVLALGSWGWGRWVATTDPFDDRFWETHEDGDWVGFGGIIRDLFAPRSVIDLGCGSGQTLLGLHAGEPALRLTGIDASSTAIARARSRGLEVHRCDLGGLTGAALADWQQQVASYDVAVCLEVAEHLPSWQACRLVSLLAACRTVVFSAAPPHQGGLHHVNEQPFEYWRHQFHRAGLGLSSRNAEFRRRLAALELPWWYRRNAHVFGRLGLGS